MSIETALATVRQRIANAYDAAEEKGATMPATENLDNLADTIASITGGGGGGQTTLILNKMNGAFYGSTVKEQDYHNSNMVSLNLSESGLIPFIVAIRTSPSGSGNYGYVDRSTYRIGATGYAMNNSRDYYGSAGHLSINDLYNQEKTIIAVGFGSWTSAMVTVKITGTTLTIMGDTTGSSADDDWTTNNYETFKIIVTRPDGSGWDEDTFSFYVHAGGCFLKDTKITLADRTEKFVQDITYDDELLVWNFDEGKFDTAKPFWIKKEEKINYYFENEYASGNILLTTGTSSTGYGHRHYDITREKFLYTPSTVGDNIFTLNGVDEHISCKKHYDICEYYNIITEKHFNLFANGILTSCSLNNNLYPIKDMKFDKSKQKEQRLFESYDVPIEYFNALRLAESDRDIDETNRYVNNLIALRK